ncbi:hypothetical protein K466DRAFT_529784 [Polyporus arcularius HHB13444]|uniref:Uncharacterized protein n=1 Tax=Polyporus arcularius HHB13444 TaxID=1314778 RepID=A0A5C3NZX8_9APHY|nr:hypothetical protein K466DRAFT_529784 [Polyporus arcularius HHB13444]
MSIETDEDPDNVAVSPNSTSWQYTCLHRIHEVVAACLGDSGIVQDVLVMRPEYVWLRETIETGYLRRDKAIVVMGHPGIGKTVFLLQLLLHRLEHKLPTAIHLFGEYLVVFNDEGATIRGAKDIIQLASDHWALSDSNDSIEKPCGAFRRSAARIIQASSPRPDRWEEWTKQRTASIIVTDLPRPLEIGATYCELGLNVAETNRYFSQWGPCTRTILDLLSRSFDSRLAAEDNYIQAAQTAAEVICAHPAAYANPVTIMAPSVGLTILFVVPYRPLVPGTSRVARSVRSIYHIPTTYLSEIFNSVRQSLAYEKALQLFQALSLHSLTRPAAAWKFEKSVHVHLSSNSPPLSIFNRHQMSEMVPSQQLLAGTAAALARCSEFSSFYWLPSASNFPGVDGVLANRRNIYAVQANIADEYNSPEQGLQKVWAMFDQEVRDQRVWHVVFVADSKTLASRYVATYAKELKDFALGQDKVTVWGCVLPSS